MGLDSEAICRLARAMMKVLLSSASHTRECVMITWRICRRDRVDSLSTTHAISQEYISIALHPQQETSLCRSRYFNMRISYPKVIDNSARYSEVLLRESAKHLELTASHNECVSAHLPSRVWSTARRNPSYPSFIYPQMGPRVRNASRHTCASSFAW